MEKILKCNSKMRRLYYTLLRHCVEAHDIVSTEREKDLDFAIREAYAEEKKLESEYEVWRSGNRQAKILKRKVSLADGTIDYLEFMQFVEFAIQWVQKTFFYIDFEVFFVYRDYIKGIIGRRTAIEILKGKDYVPTRIKSFLGFKEFLA